MSRDREHRSYFLTSGGADMLANLAAIGPTTTQMAQLAEFSALHGLRIGSTLSTPGPFTAGSPIPLGTLHANISYDGPPIDRFLSERLVSTLTSRISYPEAQPNIPLKMNVMSRRKEFWIS